jgi:hypothetical protein
MARLPPIAAFALQHSRQVILAAVCVTAVVISVSFVANIHGLNHIALEQRGIILRQDVQHMRLDQGPAASSLRDMLDADAEPTADDEDKAHKHSLADAQKFVDEYGTGIFSSVSDAPAALAAPHQHQEAYSSIADGLALAPPLPGAIEPAYTSLSTHWIPMKATSHPAAVLAASGSSQCFDVKNLKKFLPPGFGSMFKSLKKGSNPLDKFLIKAMLPTFGELQGAVKCVPSIAKSLKAAARSPKTALSALTAIDKCMTNLAAIVDKCQSSPSMLAISAVPKAGPMVSYVCGLLSKLVEKYKPLPRTRQLFFAIELSPSTGTCSSRNM